VDHYRRALAVDQKNETVILNLARALVGGGDLPQARDVYRDLVRAAPQNWDAIFELGKTHASLGENREAKQVLEDLVKRNPNYSGRKEAERILAGI